MGIVTTLDLLRWVAAGFTPTRDRNAAGSSLDSFTRGIRRGLRSL